jgi:hypothetical protein
MFEFNDMGMNLNHFIFRLNFWEDKKMVPSVTHLEMLKATKQLKKGLKPSPSWTQVLIRNPTFFKYF